MNGFVSRCLRVLAFLLVAAAAQAAPYPDPVHGDFLIRDFRFAAGELFGGGQPLDANRWFIIVPDNIGHGKSSKPSDGLRAKFPRYVYGDMVEAQYRLITEGLGVDHLRIIVGTSMGGMHAWMWLVAHPQFMDAALPLVCLPAQIAGRNRMERRLIVDAIRNDPEWNGGDYDPGPGLERIRAAVTAVNFEDDERNPPAELMLIELQKTLFHITHIWHEREPQ